jgi:hypothetical protein
MITETEIMTLLSGSFIGDYPSVLTDADARTIAMDIFKKIFDVKQNGSIDSILFYEAINTNPNALAELHMIRLDKALNNLNNLVETVLPNALSYKLLWTINPDEAPPEINRAVLLDQRKRLGEIFKTTANVPTVLSINLID